MAGHKVELPGPDRGRGGGDPAYFGSAACGALAGRFGVRSNCIYVSDLRPNHSELINLNRKLRLMWVDKMGRLSYKQLGIY